MHIMHITDTTIYMHIRAGPFWVILEFQLAWVLHFCLWPKEMGNPKFFRNRTPFTYCPGAFLNRAPQNILISIEIEPFELNMQYWYSYLMFFGEKDINDLESCFRVTSNFFSFL